MNRKIPGCFLAFILLFSAPIFSYSYKIDNYNFEITGKTQEIAIQREIQIDTKTIFKDETTFLTYIDELKQRFINLRNFDEIEITYTASAPEDDLCLINLTITIKDSFHFLAMPYIKYSTSNGLSARIKMKDTNFLGTLNELNSSFNFNLKPDEDGNQFRIFEPEFSFEYDFPFKAGPFDFTWTNNYNISYAWGENSPEWSAETGIVLLYPLEHTNFRAEFKQGFFRDFEYRDYDDDIYLSENLKLSTPMNIFEIPHYAPIEFEPYVNFNYNFDPFNQNGFSGFGHPDLMGPIISTGTDFNFEYVNWEGNFRNGFSLSFGPSVSYNFASISNSDVTAYCFGLNVYANAYKSYEYIGFNTRFWGFGYLLNGTTIPVDARIDTYLRGIVDNRKSNYNPKCYQDETPSALIFNFDLPIHILTTNWENYALTRKIPFMKYFNFELQISPFVDIALIQTTEKRHGYGRLFNLKDGFYTAGVEFLVFSKRWKSTIVRGSIGFDVGTSLFGNFIETSWRNKIDNGFEISIGIGLQY